RSGFFFFQAEDGIRDFHVTGVQTCALPIWAVRGFSGRPEHAGWLWSLVLLATALIWLFSAWWPHYSARVMLVSAVGMVGLALIRSEERRVGKEGRTQGDEQQ